LAKVKTSEGRLSQISWHVTISAMDLSGKPFGDIAARLRWHRALEGLEQKEYAEKAGLKRSQLSNWESGDYRLSLDGARSLRRTYGLSLDFMFEGIDDALPMTLRAAWRDKR
jgi:transcriptional regulator with XRE-family HTH domain